MDAVALTVPEVSFPNGEPRPALGLGTWRFGEAADRRAAELDSLRQALEMGWRVIDTAEMYGDGGAESLTGEALAAAQRAGVPRGELFVVSKALPQHAGARALQAACEASLRRLQLDQLDLYLLHWRGDVPVGETVRGFEQLQRRGLIRLWGVSNFDLDDMRELSAVPGGRACATNQVYYSLSQRGVEHDLLPWQRVQQMPLMAYSPFDQGELVDHPRLRPVAERHRATPAQVALAWLLRQPGVMAIPKAGNALHLRHNWAAQRLKLTAEDLVELDRHFAPPRGRQPLAVR
ncbi:MAG: aldo/keto reductase [Betaproteobacteria bacterium]|nr:aldo/keto reductase [Betaproteobacteria bacterium]